MAGVSSSDAFADQVADLTQLPAGCRLLIVQRLDRTARAAWRTACRRTRQDVQAATRALIWCGKDQEHTCRVAGAAVSPCPSSLPLPLIAGLPNLHRLNCSSMKKLTSIQGIPATLRSLDLTDCMSIDSLLPLQHCTALEQLAFVCTLNTARHWKSLAETLPQIMSAASPHLQQLKLKIFDNEMSDAAAHATMRSLLPLSGLRELSFCLQPSKVEHWQMFAGALGQMTGLQALDLSDNNFKGDSMTPSALAPLPAIMQLGQLRSLNLSRTWMDSEAITAWAQAIASLPGKLTRFDMDFVPIRFTAVALAPALQAHSATLSALKLSSTFLGPAGLAGLASGLQHCSTLTDLDLSDCDLTEYGGDVLASALSGCTPSLTSLDISANELGDEGTAALAPALSCMSSLAMLNYSSNCLGAEGAGSLADPLLALAPSLTSLDISRNCLGEEGAAALAPALGSLTALVHLRYTSNKLGPAGAALLAPALLSIAPSLTHLDLSGNPQLGDDGVAALAPALPALHCEQLLLCGSGIGAAGAAALASALPTMTRLQYIDLKDNLVGYQGLKALAEGLQARKRRQHWRVQCPRTLFIMQSGTGSPPRSEVAQVLASILSHVGSWQVQPALFPLQGAPSEVKVLGLDIIL